MICQVESKVYANMDGVLKSIYILVAFMGAKTFLWSVCFFVTYIFRTISFEWKFCTKYRKNCRYSNVPSLTQYCFWYWGDCYLSPIAMCLLCFWSVALRIAKDGFQLDVAEVNLDLLIDWLIFASWKKTTLMLKFGHPTLIWTCVWTWLPICLNYGPKNLNDY